ncbi:MAG: hypothetical protein ABJE47_03605 [bacterium]
MPSASLRSLLTGLIDYAGLFPPAALPMSEVVTNYDHYRRSDDRWALGRIVVPVARLRELADAAAALPLPPDGVWAISALVGDDCLHDAADIDAWNQAEAGRFIVDSVEVRATSADSIGRAASALSARSNVYVEIPVTDDPDRLIAAIKDNGVRAKIRTGGVTSDAFPTAPQVARFLSLCARHGVSLKATAGLHHPLRAEHRLSYADDAPLGTMFGFLNMFIAAAFARAGMSDDELVRVLEERDAQAFRFSAGAVTWRSQSLTMARISDARSWFAIAFGSCSFREPMHDLDELGLL